MQENQQKLQRILLLIEGSLHAVDRGTKIANETAKALQQLTEGVQSSTDH